MKIKEVIKMRRQLEDFITTNQTMKKCYRLERSLGKSTPEVVDILLNRTQVALRFLSMKEVVKQYGSMINFNDEVAKTKGKVNLMDSIVEKILTEQVEQLGEEVMKITLAKREGQPLDDLYGFLEEVSGKKIL